MLICNVCHESKSTDSFSRDARRRTGRQARCKACARDIAAKWRRANPERHSATRRAWEAANPERHLFTKFGIRASDKRALLAKQGSVCAACGDTKHGHPRIQGEAGWCLDHCHATGEIRGVLCWRCNVALGYVKDSPEKLRQLATYLENAAKNILRLGYQPPSAGTGNLLTHEYQLKDQQP